MTNYYDLSLNGEVVAKSVPERYLMTLVEALLGKNPNNALLISATTTTTTAMGVIDD